MYGAADVDDTQPSGSTPTASGGARTPLLAKPSPSSSVGDGQDLDLDARGRPQGPGTIVSSVGNLANTIIGSGMLSFPLAMASAGLIPGIITCIFSGAVAFLGLYLLSRCATRTAHRHASFFAVAQLTYPRAAVFFDAAIAVKCFGVSISYLIIIKGLMPNVVQSLYHVLTPPSHEPPAWALDGRLWITLFMGVLVPLCFLRRLDSLRHTSYVAMFSVVYLVAVVVVCYVRPPPGTVPRGEVRLVHFTSGFVGTFPVQVFAFTCAQNLFPIFNELWSNNQERITLVIGASIGSAVVTYEIIAILGYLTFGSKVGANIIAMYPSTSLFIAGGQLAIVLLVLFSYPLQVHPCRNCLDKVFHDAVVPPSPDEEVEDEFAPDTMSPLKHTLLTAGIVLCGFAVAWAVDDLKLVLSFVGSTGSTTISFILPGLFYYKLFKDEPDEKPWLRPAAAALFVYGVLIMIFCLSYNVYSVVHPEGDGPAELGRRAVVSLWALGSS